MARSRSTSRVRRNYRDRSRSRSLRRRPDHSHNRSGRSSTETGNFFVPYRCLIPPECAGYVIGTGATLLKRVTEDTGAHISVIQKDASPKGLSDRIVVISGSLRSRNDALCWMIERIRKYFDKTDRDRDMFVCLIPDTAAPLVIGARGAVIKKIRDDSGADIDIPSSAAPGLSDRGITIKGSVRETVAAISDLNEILQEYIGKGRLVRSDFSFCDRFVEQSRDNSPEIRRSRPETPDDMPKFDVDDNYDSKLPARFLVTTEQADWLTSSPIVNKLKAIESQNNTLIDITDTARLGAVLSPPVSDTSPPPEVVQIQGSFRNKLLTTIEVLKLFFAEGMRKVRFLVPLSRSKYLVGVRGHTINAIRKASEGSLIEFADSKNPPTSLKKLFLLNILDVSHNSQIEPILEATRLILRKLDHTVFEDESRNTPLDPHSREPVQGSTTEPPNNTISKILSQLPSTEGEEQLVVHLSGDQMDAIQPQIENIQNEMMDDGERCMMHVNKSSLILQGKRSNILTAVWYLLDSISGVGSSTGIDRKSDHDDNVVVDYNEY